jgi:hypothetical protein
MEDARLADNGGDDMQSAWSLEWLWQRHPRLLRKAVSLSATTPLRCHHAGDGLQPTQCPDSDCEAGRNFSIRIRESAHLRVEQQLVIVLRAARRRRRLHRGLQRAQQQQRAARAADPCTMQYS